MLEKANTIDEILLHKVKEEIERKLIGMNSVRKGNKMELFYNAAGLLRKASHSRTLRESYMEIDDSGFVNLYKTLNSMEHSIDTDIQYCNNLLNKLRSSSNKGQTNKQN